MIASGKISKKKKKKGKLLFFALYEFKINKKWRVFFIFLKI